MILVEAKVAADPDLCSKFDSCRNKQLDVQEQQRLNQQVTIAADEAHLCLEKLPGMACNQPLPFLLGAGIRPALTAKECLLQPQTDKSRLY